MNRVVEIFFVLCFLVVLVFTSLGDEFTKEDRGRLIRIETTLKVYMEQNDRRIQELISYVNRRFEQINNTLIVLSTMFGGMVVAIIGFALWDRRTMVERARKKAVRSVESDSKLVDVINALKEFSVDNPKLAEVMRKFRLL